MRVGDLPEKDFIATVLSRYAETASKDAFEDCVVIDTGGTDPGRPVVVLNVDHPSYVRGSFRDLDDYRFYGRWVAAGTCGDVISMGVRPSGFALDLAVPLDMEVAKVEAIYQGVRTVLDDYGCRLSGGNLDANKLELVGVAWGVGRYDRLVRRQGARPGDRLIVTCDLGVGWSGHLLDRLGVRDRVPAELSEPAARYHEHTRAPIEPILAAAEAGLLTSGMDLSDGVVEFCYTIAERNGLGVELDEAAMGNHPLTRAVADLIDLRPGLLALEPGFDFPYAHGYTVPAAEVDRVRDMFAAAGATCQVIGDVVPEAGVRLRQPDGRRVRVPPFWSDQAESGSAALSRWRSFAATLQGGPVRTLVP